MGSHLLKRLLKDGYRVSIIKRSFSNTDRIREVLLHENLFIHNIDLTDVEEIFKAKKVDAIVHTATEYGRNDGAIHKILEANVILPVKLIEMGIKYSVKSFLNTDSYFNKDNYNYSNLLNYSLSKRSLLIWLKQFSSRIQILNVSLEHIFGPYDSDSKFVEMLFQSIVIKKIDRVSLTHGHQRRDFIYIDDVVDAYVTLINYADTHSFSYRNFEIGSGKCFEIRELAQKIKTSSASPTVLGFGDIPYRYDEIMQSQADTRQITELGWRPQTSLDQGIDKILQAYRSAI
jgi:CDP-paratose synthetase